MKETVVPAARPRHAYLLLLCGCMAVMASVLIAPNLPLMQSHFAAVPGADYLVPVTLTLPALVVAVLSLFIGAAADRVGRKALLVLGMALYALFGTAPVWLDSLDLILASRLGVGLAEALIAICCTALIGDYYSGLQRDRYLALNTTFSSISAVLFLGLGGVLGEYGWRTPFAVYAGSLALMLAVSLMLWEPVRRVPAQDGGAGESEDEFSASRQCLICLVTVLGAVLFMAIQVHIGYLMEAVGVRSPAVIGGVAAAGQLAVVLGSLAFRVLLRMGTTTLLRLALSFGVPAVGFLIVGSAATDRGVLAGVLVTGFGAGLMLPTLLCWNMEGLPGRKRAFGTGAWMAAFFGGQFLTPLLVVGLSKAVGGVGAALAWIGLAVLPAALILLVVALAARKAAHEFSIGGGARRR
ncbi:MFS transporter [Castellaniella defragrans]|uniref:MFS family permease n=1 Tax=Castellaniella defragrans TaxID=75697 RepID=A0A7W9TQL2_CASDE|nr:MFS transporter [Castellaniella defragrans]KAB0622262.1 MFS transporter [Castellaniella defragrans]MBB6084208.1 MFS family permease [Castellaniella defragrans]